MRYFFVAGEPSGDLHASYLIQSLKKMDADAVFCGIGGDLMQKQGMELKQHYNQHSFMGFIEVFLHLRSIVKNLKYCQQSLLTFNPDVLILVDYAGFNMRMAKFAHQHGIKVVYYIAPKAWAWKKNRVYSLKKYVDKLYVILPFEVSFFSSFDIDTTYLGNPLLDELSLSSNPQERDLFFRHNALSDKPIIALFPGSRTQEIRAVLPVFLDVVSMWTDYQFVIAGAPGKDMTFYQQFVGEDSPVKVIFEQGGVLMKYASAGLITSGTATLEAALFNLPQVICYKGNPITIAIAKRVVKTSYIGLANLIMNRAIIPEIIQKEVTVERLKIELNRMLYDAQVRERLFADYADLREVMGEGGVANRIASGISEFVREK